MEYLSVTVESPRRPVPPYRGRWKDPGDNEGDGSVGGSEDKGSSRDDSVASEPSRPFVTIYRTTS